MGWPIGGKPTAMRTVRDCLATRLTSASSRRSSAARSPHARSAAAAIARVFCRSRMRSALAEVSPASQGLGHERQRSSRDSGEEPLRWLQLSLLQIDNSGGDLTISVFEPLRAGSGLVAALQFAAPPLPARSPALPIIAPPPAISPPTPPRSIGLDWRFPGCLSFALSRHVTSSRWNGPFLDTPTECKQSTPP